MKVLPYRTYSVLMDAVFHSGENPGLVIDADGIVVAWNTLAERLTTFPRERALWQPLNELIVLPARWAAELADSGSTHDNNPRQLRAAVRSSSGQHFPVQLVAKPLDVAGQRFYSVVLYDLSESTSKPEIRQGDFEQHDGPLDLMQLLDCSSDVICAIDEFYLFVHVSAASESVWGYGADDIIGRCFLDFVYPADHGTTLQEATRLRQGSPTVEFKNRYVHRNGSVVTMSWTANWSAGARTYCCVGRKVAQAVPNSSADAIANAQYLQSLYEQHPDGVFAFDLSGRMLCANYAFSVLTGYAQEELTAITSHIGGFRNLLAGESQAAAESQFLTAMRGEPIEFETTAVRKDGSHYQALIIAFPMTINDTIVGVHGVVRDITAHKNDQRRIEYLATHDRLTGLPNRNLLDDRLTHAVSQASRQGHLIGILFINLNRFKIINDSLGHRVGDKLLQIIAGRLSHRVRQTDTVARIGGDEFVVALEDVYSPEHVIGFARDLLEVIEQPVTLDEHEFSVFGSVGCSLYPKDGHDGATLLRNANLAMYEAKASGGRAFRFYKPDMNERVKTRLLQENQLRLALERQELVLHYQPRIDLANHRIVGVEALVRWQHPRRGMVPPNEFIPLAEEIGLIGELGEWVLHTACHQNQLWQKAGVSPLKVAVNLSSFQLVPDSKIAEAVYASLSNSGLDAQWLELEITESGLMQNVESTLEKLSEIRAAGVSIAIDDFGTGYSSLSHLQRLPVDALKIDQSFVRDIVSKRDDAAIVAATIALAHTMQLKVVAEGVTTIDQMTFLREHECDEVQGFLYSPAVPAETLARLMGNSGFVQIDGLPH